jgi:hypothetical protein
MPTLVNPPTLADAERNIAEAERVAELWREIAEVLKRTNGHASEVQRVTRVSLSDTAVNHSEGKPRGREAVRNIVADRQGVWTISELKEEMLRRGWFTSQKGLEVAITRLCNSKEARRVGRGRYDFSTNREGDAT